jgi:hypothetical protein
VFASRTRESLRKTIVEDIERVFAYAPTVEVLPNPPGAQQPVVVRGNTLRYTQFLHFPKGTFCTPDGLKGFGDMVLLDGTPCLVVEERLVEAYRQALATARKHAEMMAQVKPTLALLSDPERLMALPLEAKKDLFAFGKRWEPRDSVEWYDRNLRSYVGGYTMEEPSILSFEQADIEGVRMWLFGTLMKPRDTAGAYKAEGLVFVDGRWRLPAFKGE